MIGLNRWDHVHITDTAALYMLVYTQALTDSIPHGEEGYYLACSGDYSSLDIGRAIGEEMVDLGLASTAEVTSFREDDTRYRVGFSGTNARAVGKRAKEIGWKPNYEKLDDLLDYVKREVRTIAAKKRQS
jgi:nucleoside-diphosphate-sugar epimerase